MSQQLSEKNPFYDYKVLDDASDFLRLIMAYQYVKNTIILRNTKKN